MLLSTSKRTVLNHVFEAISRLPSSRRHRTLLQALLACRHLPSMCATTPALAAAPGSFIALYSPSGCHAAVIATHFLAGGALPALLIRATEAAMRRRFVRQLCGNAAAITPEADADQEGSTHAAESPPREAAAAAAVAC